MDRFRRLVAVLLVLLMLAGCGPRRAAAPALPTYHVTFSDAVTQRLTPARLVPGKSARNSSGGGNWNCNFGSSSGGDLAAAIVVAVVVIVVVAVVVTAINEDDGQPAPSWRYALHLTSDGLPIEVIHITDEEVMYVTREQYDAIAHGAFSRVTIQPAAWAKKEPPPVVPVHLAIDNGRIRVELPDTMQ